MVQKQHSILDDVLEGLRRIMGEFERALKPQKEREPAPVPIPVRPQVPSQRGDENRSYR